MLKKKPPSVSAASDEGNTIHTQRINDLATKLADAIGAYPDLLAAALPIITDYNAQFLLRETELKELYTLVAECLAINGAKSTSILLKKWAEISPQLAHFSFRKACGFTPVPSEKIFNDWAKNEVFDVKKLMPTVDFKDVLKLDLSTSSTFMNHYFEHQNVDIFTRKINEYQAQNVNKLMAGGYLETRSWYSTDAYKIEGNNGYEHRTTHLGVDFWQKEGTPIHALFDSEVVDFSYNGADKDYGGVIILEHKPRKNLTFYTLYGHLSKSSIANLKVGQKIKKDKKIGELGLPSENGNWTPHLHFQIMLDLLGYEKDFPGVGLPSTIDVWSSICPDPNLLFKNKNLM